MTNFNSEMGQSENIEKGLLQNSKHIDLNMDATSPDLDERDKDHAGNVNVNSFSEVSAEHLGANHPPKVTKRYHSREQDMECGKKKRKLLADNEDGVGSSLNSSSGDKTYNPGCSEIKIEDATLPSSDSDILRSDSTKDKGDDNLHTVNPGCSEIKIENQILSSSDSDMLRSNCTKDKVEENLHTLKPGCSEIKVEDQILSSSDADMRRSDSTKVRDEANLHPEILQCSEDKAPIGSVKKKLLVLDVNGLIADIVSDLPDGCGADAFIGRKAVFKRPFCDDFLQFCFERFNVGVWSSRTKRNVKSVLDFIMGETSKKLLFCWDQSLCTETGFNTVENREKPLLLKELKKLWEKHETNLPWEKGDYDESNTLLLDDSPYKALRNPPNTAIFPSTYHYRNRKDTSLGPCGDLRIYLDKLSLSENVQKYVEQNPYGQRSINKSNISWPFYLKVIGSTSTQDENKSNRSTLDHSRMENKMKIEIEKSKEIKVEDSTNLKATSSNDLVGENSKTTKRDVPYTNQYFGSVYTRKPLEQKRQSYTEESKSSSQELIASSSYQSVKMTKEVNHRITPHLGRNLPVRSRRKLIVLDLNSILVDVVPQHCDGYDGHKSDTVIANKAVFKRPFCDDFLHFCFERFNVGVWSSGPKVQLQMLVDYLMPKSRHKLFFCWDISYCTSTGFNTVEHRDRALLLKELRKLWDKTDPRLPWRRGEYNESNTLLLDIAPHKALRNPPNTAVFPNPYRYIQQDDTSLGPEGDLRCYLKGVDAAENVQRYVAQYRFGQRAITEKNLSWQYYLKVIGDANN
jgi:hypothetical protein